MGNTSSCVHYIFVYPRPSFSPFFYLHLMRPVEVKKQRQKSKAKKGASCLVFLAVTSMFVAEERWIVAPLLCLPVVFSLFFLPFLRMKKKVDGMQKVMNDGTR